MVTVRFKVVGSRSRVSRVMISRITLRVNRVRARGPSE